MEEPVFPYHILRELEEEYEKENKAEEGKKSKKEKDKKKNKIVQFEPHVESISGVSKEDNTENPKKTTIKDKKPKMLKTVEVPIEENLGKNVYMNEPTKEESFDEYERTMNELMK